MAYVGLVSRGGLSESEFPRRGPHKGKANELCRNARDGRPSRAVARLRGRRLDRRRERRRDGVRHAHRHTHADATPHYGNANADAVVVGDPVALRDAVADAAPAAQRRGDV